MKFIFDPDETFSYETLRAVGYTPYGGADIGEVVATTARITSGDIESWFQEWRALADRIATAANVSAAGGHEISASSAYLRASNYYRASEFFLRDDPANDSRVADTSALAIAAFTSAAKIQTEWDEVRIPYEGVELKGYFLNVTGDEAGPTLLAHGGFDSTVEEMYYAVGEAARRYGWNCLIFEGPGQGSALRIDKLPFRYDWEAVVTPTVDVAVTLRGVDPERIALIGMSLGGYLAPRAAAFEPRISALIAYDGVFRIAGAFESDSDGQHRDSEQQIAAMDKMLAHRSELPTGQRWLLSNSLWALGVTTAEELLREVAKYDLTDVAHRIACPTLVCDGEDDMFGKGQAPLLYDALECPKTFERFTAAEGAGAHCQSGALTMFHQRMFDWLDDTLR